MTSESFTTAASKLDFHIVLSRISAFAVSALGAEAVLELRPHIVYAEISDELERIREMIQLLDAGDSPPLDRIHPIGSILHTASIPGSMLTGEDIRKVYDVLTTSRILTEFFHRRAEKNPHLAGLKNFLFHDKVLEFHLDRVVDEEGKVRDKASKEIARLRREIVEQTRRLRHRLEIILRRVAKENLAQDEIITLRDGRMVIPVKAAYKHSVDGFIHSASATGQTVYIEPAETLELNNFIRELEIEEQREVASLLTELTDRIRAVAKDILRTLEILAWIDSIYARARYAREYDAVIPVIGTEVLSIKNGLHPVLLEHKKRQDVVPLTLRLGDDFTTLLITGPNAGGKSVAIKTVGLLALMLQSGIPVPCHQDSTFPIYQKISVDIGDEQSVENDISTFSSHIQSMTSILEHIDKRELVLLDEIGTGTDPAEGSALAAAILEKLTEVKAHVLATTHLGMLKGFVHDKPDMENAAMEFNTKTLEPTYRLRVGFPGSSYAFEIARRQGMPADILDRARELLGDQTYSLEHMLADLERQAQELSREQREFQEEKKHMQSLLDEIEDRHRRLNEEIRIKRKAAEEEASSILSDANRAVEKAIREIRESQADKETVKRHREEIQRRKKALKPSEEPASASPDEKSLAPHDVVALSNNREMTGILLEMKDNGKAVVAFGSVKMIVDLSDLMLIQKSDTRPSGPGGKTSIFPGQQVESNRLDVRGLYGDEAVMETERFLYAALSSGLRSVDILHGKGTGALRRRIHEYLQTCPIVKSYKLADWLRGGEGITEVELDDT